MSIPKQAKKQNQHDFHTFLNRILTSHLEIKVHDRNKG
jgi:hypothetical protein